MRKQLGEIELSDFDLAAVRASDIAGCDEETLEARPDLTAIPDNVFGLWVRFRGTLADGTEIAGIAIARTPPPDFVAHSFFIDGEWHSVHFAPAPDFVLAHDGPERFAQRLGRQISQVFPIEIHSDLATARTGERIHQTLAAEGFLG